LAANRTSGSRFAAGYWTSVLLAGSRARCRQAKDISKEGWKLVRADSEETVVIDAAAAKAFDDDRDTFWHTAWHDTSPAHLPPPHEHSVCRPLRGATSLSPSP